MSEDLLSAFKAQLEAAEKESEGIEKLIDVATKAGEDTVSLRANLKNVKAKIAKWKRALGE